MKNQVIKNLNPKMGKKIIKYFQSLGINTRYYTGSNNEQNNDYYIYYGVINGIFHNYCISQVQKKNVEIIELPTMLPKRGNKILVWDNNEENALEVIFLANIKKSSEPIITVAPNFENEYLNNETFLTANWKNWKPIKEEIIVELTLEDISNGKSIGIKPHLIKIKK